MKKISLEQLEFCSRPGGVHWLLEEAASRIRQQLQAPEPNESVVVAVLGVATLFGLVRVSDLVFVRWKQLAEQPIGREPDLDDGVRLNIRPFVTANVLRKRPGIKWDKDRGKDPASAPWYPVFHGDRINDHHLALAEKLAARDRAAGARP